VGGFEFGIGMIFLERTAGDAAVSADVDVVVVVSVAVAVAVSD